MQSESVSRSVVSDSLQPHGLYSPWDSPGQNTGVGCLSLLQGFFLTQGSNPGLPHCRRIIYQVIDANILPILKIGFLAHHSYKKESFIFCRDSSFTADNMQIFPPGLPLLFGFNQRCLFLSIYLFLLWADLGLGFGAGFWSFLHALKCAGFSCRTAQAFGRGCSGGVNGLRCSEACEVSKLGVLQRQVDSLQPGHQGKPSGITWNVGGRKALETQVEGSANHPSRARWDGPKPH